MIRHTRNSYGIKAGAEKFPLMVVISMSNVCNAKCPHCVYTNFPDFRAAYGDNRLMPPDLFKKIADECGQYGALIRISGTGEPFVHKEMVDLVEYAKGKGAKVGIITNGSLLDDNKIIRLIKAGVEAIEVSVDAMNAEAYAKIRVGLSFDEVQGNIERLVETRNRLKGKTRVMVSVINQPNVNLDIEAAVAYWQKKVDHVIKRKWLRWGKLSDKNLTEPYLDPRRRVPCPFPFERFNVDTSGIVRFCGYDVEYGTNMGNVYESSLEEIWKGEKFNEWRSYHLRGEFDRIDMCKDCTDWPYRSWNYNYWRALRDAQKSFI